MTHLPANYVSKNRSNSFNRVDSESSFSGLKNAPPLNQQRVSRGSSIALQTNPVSNLLRRAPALVDLRPSLHRGDSSFLPDIETSSKNKKIWQNLQAVLDGSSKPMRQKRPNRPLSNLTNISQPATSHPIASPTKDVQRRDQRKAFFALQLQARQEVKKQAFYLLSTVKNSPRVRINFIQAELNLTIAQAEQFFKEYMKESSITLNHSSKPMPQKRSNRPLSNLTNISQPTTSHPIGLPPKAPEQYSVESMKSIFNAIANRSGNVAECEAYFSRAKGNERSRFHAFTGYDLFKLKGPASLMKFDGIFNDAYFDLVNELDQIDRSTKTLDLRGKGLKILPTSVFEFNNLETLILDDNQLIAIPEHIIVMRKLTVLSANNNKLEHLPIRLNTLKNLKILLLNNNLFTFEKLAPVIVQLMSKSLACFSFLENNFKAPEAPKNFIYDKTLKAYCKACEPADKSLYPVDSWEYKTLDKQPLSPILKPHSYAYLQNLKRLFRK